MYYYFLKRAICIGLAAVLCVFSTGAQDLRLRTVAIDAGHGGRDPGAVSKDHKTYEKTLTLDIARRLSSKITESCPDIKVIQTRPTDYYVELLDRANAANKADADLFISIHINSVASTSANGCSVHILGQSQKHDLLAYNMEVCRRENSVILLEEDYTTKYQGFDPSDPESFIFMSLMQNAHLEQSMTFAQMIAEKLQTGPIPKSRGVWQDPLYLLWKTSMPAVLVELGFISNSSDLETLKNPEKREELAQKLFEAFQDYRRLYDSSFVVSSSTAAGASAANSIDGVSAPVPSPEAAAPAQNHAETAENHAETAVEPAIVEKFGVQIFAGSTLLKSNDRRFLGYEPEIVTSGKIYKYVIGVCGSPEEAKANADTIKCSYPDCFPVKISGNSTIPLK